MRSILASVLAFTWLAALLPSVSEAQQMELRRLSGGVIHVQSVGGVRLAIQPATPLALQAGTQANTQPSTQAVSANSFRAQLSFFVGSEFQRAVVKADGQGGLEELQLDAAAPLPPQAISIESVLIGEKRAGVQLQTSNLNVLFASVELISDQGWITTHKDKPIHLLVLTFNDAAKLQTARLNLWISSVKAQQILLNSSGALTMATAEAFYQSIGKQKVLPTVMLPVLQLPQRGSNFGDRQVVLLKEIR
ncbi:MAG: hypothetical protein IT423_13000 [Pirellulaceae bacterium]|nr:hypothetical protein [Pirellulaceae bacterium]